MKQSPPLLPRAPSSGLRVFIHTSLWGSLLCGLPSTGRYLLVPERIIGAHFLGINECDSIQFSNYSKRRSEGIGLTAGHHQYGSFSTCKRHPGSLPTPVHTCPYPRPCPAHSQPLQLEHSILRTDSIVTNL